MTNTGTPAPVPPGVFSWPQAIQADPALLGFLLFPLGIVLVALLSLTQRRGQLSDGRLASSAEKQKLRQRVRQQIAAQQPNQAAVWLNSCHSLGLPNCQQSTLVVGKSGSGKTFSSLEPALRSAIQQGWSLLVYDVKGSLQQRIGPYAKAWGYQVWVFAPGFAHSGCINPLDFMRDDADATMARQLAIALSRGGEQSQTRRDGFFGPAGEGVLQLALQLAKGTEDYGDLATARAFLGLSQLPQRLIAAQQEGRLSPWLSLAATDLIATAHAEQTVGGILANASVPLSKLVVSDFLPCLMGPSSVPLDLSGRQILFLQIDEQRQDVTAPLVAAVLEGLMARNLNASVQRDRPLGVFLDEVDTLYLRSLSRWAALNREYGQCLFLGVQNPSQFRERYGREMATTILANCSNRLIFNPGDVETAQLWSKEIGERDVRYRTNSFSGGKKTRSEHLQTKPLFPPERLTQFQAGECVLLSDSLGRPWHLRRVPIPPQDAALGRQSQSLWQQRLLPELLEQAAVIDDLAEAISDRDVMAEISLPLPLPVAAPASRSPLP